MKRIDLHVHSTASDGTLTPSEIVAYALEKNLSALALTDHDTIKGVDEAIEAAKDSNLEVIPGIEISATYKGKEIHILGLFVNYKDYNLIDTLDKLEQKRNERNLIMAERLTALGMDVSLEDMEKVFSDSVITRMHFARYLLNKGYVTSTNEAFTRYLGDGCSCYVKKEEVSPYMAIKLIHDAGGLAILAHPTLYKMNNSNIGIMISELASIGIDGVEGIYSTYTQGEEIMIRKYAKEYGLLISGGSDFHGSNKPHIDLGTGRGHLYVDYDILTNLKGVL